MRETLVIAAGAVCETPARVDTRLRRGVLWTSVPPSGARQVNHLAGGHTSGEHPAPRRLEGLAGAGAGLRIVEAAAANEELVVQRPVEQVDAGVDVEIRAQQAAIDAGLDWPFGRGARFGWVRSGGLDIHGVARR